ncbi:hypothetical protein FOMPIDRAFT_1056740 [Fomitopsis schrenkii]|uniref:DUF6589 domain-containing protein n=1 Tax=Fomitopsis schrenkii TaxID=2126942 RepID=S8F0M2_FOMSC|nr:hypothetical protein FOMPIDRAFT_1056740 [Fomitopsis schrenkii]
MNATHGFMEIHYGRNTSPSNPGSLAFHNSLLDRKPIVLTSLQGFRECRDLIFVSLYARVLHCLELVCECNDLEEYAASVTLEQLQDDCAKIVQRYADSKQVDLLRTARRNAEACEAGNVLGHKTNEHRDRTRSEASPQASTMAQSRQSDRRTPGGASGDMVFENAVLFIRDALLMRLLTDTIKTGDSGRLALLLKPLALFYRGTGRSNYAQELLYLIHNLTNVWPEPLRKIIMNNWLVNPTGKANSWVEVDLMQEHLNFWIKTVYKAHGSNRSWEWLVMISPCIDVLRRLASYMNPSLGALQGTKHAATSLDKDIRQLVSSLRSHRVYEFQPGRIIDDGTGQSAVVRDSITHVLQQLAEPLKEFNTAFAKLQSRCDNTPLLGEKYSTLGVGLSEPAPVAPQASNAVAPAPAVTVPAPATAAQASTEGTSPPESPPGSLPLAAADGDESDESGHDAPSESSASSSDGAPDLDSAEAESSGENLEDEDVDFDSPTCFSLDTAEDVALDMDGDFDF